MTNILKTYKISTGGFLHIVPDYDARNPAEDNEGFVSNFLIYEGSSNRHFGAIATHYLSVDGPIDKFDEANIASRWNGERDALRIAAESDLDASDILDILEDKDECELFPLYGFVHSGSALSLTPFNCPWDSGLVGYVKVSARHMKENFGGDRESARKAVSAEISVISDYINGNTVGFYITDDIAGENDWKDSCFGFYGSDPETNGIRDNIGGEFELTEI